MERVERDSSETWKERRDTFEGSLKSCVSQPFSLRTGAIQSAPVKSNYVKMCFIMGLCPWFTRGSPVIAWILGQAVWTGRDERRCGVSAENEEKEKVRGGIRVTKRQGIPLENGQASLETCRRWIRALPLPRKLMDLKRVLSEGSRGTVVLQRI